MSPGEECRVDLEVLCYRLRSVVVTADGVGGGEDGGPAGGNSTDISFVPESGPELCPGHIWSLETF